MISWRFNKKKSGGGVVITQTSHLIYFLSFLFGEVLKVKSHLKNIYSQDKIDDYAHIILDFLKIKHVPALMPHGQYQTIELPI